MQIFNTGPASNGESVSLAGATAAGSAVSIATSAAVPKAIAITLVVASYAAGGSTNGFDAIVQHRGASSGSWENTGNRIDNINANGTYTLILTEAVYPSFRILLERNDGAATATVTVYFTYDTADGARATDTPAIMPNTLTLLAANAIAAEVDVDVDLGEACSGDPSALAFLLTTTRTAGSVAAQLKGSVDGTTYWNMPNGTAGGPGTGEGQATATLNADGTTSLVLSGAIPRYLRLTLTPSTFTGTVAVALRSSDVLYS